MFVDSLGPVPTSIQGTTTSTSPIFDRKDNLSRYNKKR